MQKRGSCGLRWVFWTEFWRKWVASGESDEGGGGARCKAAIPGDYSGKTVLHSLELEHVPNCDTMQQGVAAVKPTAHKGRRQALGLAQVQMFSDSAEVADVIVGKFANIVNVSSEIKLLIKDNIKVLAIFDGQLSLPRRVTGNMERCFILWRSWPIII